MKLQYNSPVILTFSLAAVAVFVLDSLLLPALIEHFFVVRPHISWVNPLDYLRLVSHILGHSSWGHLLGNLTYILLLGPLLEEKYRGGPLFLMIFLTALGTGLINVLFFSTGLMGASGIVFMLIILASVADIRQGSIPLTFVLVAVIFIGGELIKIFQSDHISQSAHIIGGGMGAAFGFLLARPKPKDRAAMLWERRSQMHHRK